MIQLYYKFENFEAVRRDWKNHFATDTPSINAIRNIVNKFSETGSVQDLPRSGRPRSAVNEENVEKVIETLQIEPKTSVRVGSQALGISNYAFHRSARESGFRPYRPHLVVELSDDDFDKREEFCDVFLELVAQNPGILDRIIWSDESDFKLNGIVNRHNCVYWAQSNPQERMPVPHTKIGVTVWCAITSKGIIGPYFFDGSVTAASYLEMLNDFLWPLVRHKGLYFQQDGAPAHYALNVRDWLNQKFANRWIGRRGPIEWPARSPDLAPCDFFLWGYLKNIVYQERPTTLDELKSRIRQACERIPVAMCEKACKSVADRLERCRSDGGRHITD